MERCNLILRCTSVVVLFSLLAVLCVQPVLAQPQKVTLYRWVDELGKVHYTENLEDIPERYRASAVRGEFTPSQLTPTTPTPTPPPRTTDRLELLNDSYYLEEGFVHIKGKVKNGFAQPVAQAKVKVTFFDAEERFLMTETTLVNPIVLPPGQTGNFHLIVKQNPAIDSYTIEVIGKP